MSTETLQAGNKTEIIHLPDCDILISPEGKQQLGTEEILDIVDSNLPYTWVQSTTKANIYYDSVENPKLVFKKQTEIGPQQVRMSRDPELAEYYTANTKKQINATNSILSEMRIADKIATIMTNPQLQEFVHRLGFSHLDVAKPLIGIIDKDTNIKYLAYAFISGDVATNQTESMPAITNMLRDIFLKNGINPTDLQECQFIISEDKRLTLIDTKEYYITRK